MAVREVVVEHEDDGVLQGMRVSWGGIVSGVLVVLGVLILLTALGIAVGISATDPGRTDAAAIGKGAAIWSGVSLLIALFLGGLASTRLGMVWDRTTGIVQGGLVWVLAMVLMLFLAANGVGVLLDGAMGLARTAAGAASAAGGGDLSGLESGNPDQVVSRLRDPQTASTLAAATGRPKAEVAQHLQDVAARVEAASDNPEQAAAELRAGLSGYLEEAQQRVASAAREAKPEATAGAWISFLGLILSLAAAMIGSAVGRRGAAQRVADPVRTLEDLAPAVKRDRIDPERR